MSDEIEYVVIPAENKPKCPRLDKIECKSLPSLPATFLVLGSCGSGKSSILWSLLTNGYVMGKGKKSVFHEAIIYLGTLDAKSAFEKLPIENSLVLDEFEPSTFEAYQADLKKHQMERLEKGKPMLNTLLVFDDFVNAGLMKKSAANRAPPIEKLALTSRHESNCTIFFCSQVYKNSGFTTPTVRNNITTFIVSRMSRNEIYKIADELAEDYEVDEWIAHYDLAMASDPYTFVVLDRRRPMPDRWTIKFSTPFPPSKKSMEMKKLMTRRTSVSSASSSGSE